MARHATLPPFLQKLKMISETIPSKIADWSADGLSYVVKDTESYEEVLKQHFKGSLQTFIRQLHFYGFRKVDAHTGGWSFVHKNFRRDKPELIAEIRRKTRSESAANGAASQVEVQQLRSQVAKLQDVVEELRTQLDSVLTVLDTAGVVDVVTDNNGVQDVRLPQDNEFVGRKRFRGPQYYRLEGEQEVEEDAGDTSSSSITVTQNDHDGLRTDLRESELILEPLAVDVTGMDDDNSDEIFDLSAADFYFNQLSTDDDTVGDHETEHGDLGEMSDLVSQLEADLKRVKEEQGEADVKRAREEQGEAATTAKVVADATELDAASVQKVLGFLKKAIKSDSLAQKEMPDLLSFPKIQHAILNYKNAPLPTQEVGAN